MERCLDNVRSNLQITDSGIPSRTYRSSILYTNITSFIGLKVDFHFKILARFALPTPRHMDIKVYKAASLLVPLGSTLEACSN